MKYVVFDMEWNQTMGPCRTLSDGRLLTGEIIEIGAVRLSEDFKPEDTFKVLVKPVFYRKMHRRVAELTGIDTKTLQEHGIPFKEAYDAFLKFCTEDFTTLTWGESDLPVLKENIIAHGLEKRIFNNINLQRIFDRQVLHTSKNTALDAAAQSLGITTDEPYHDAFNDALATASICMKIDMRAALESYEPPAVSLSSLDHVSYESVGGIADIQTMKSHPRIKYTLCPVCKRPLQVLRLISYGSGRRIGKLTCPDHGDYLLSVKAKKSNKDDKFNASKYVYEWTEDVAKLYEAKLKTADEKKNAFLNKIRKGKK